MKINKIFGFFDSPIRTRTSGCVYDINGLSPTLNTMQGGYREPMIIDPDFNKIRKLTVNECEKLMGWSNDWTKYGLNEKNEKFEIPYKKRLKMCGNGITSPVPKQILESILPLNQKYKILSTFSGVDGSCQALNNDFFDIIGFSEFDPDCKAQYASSVLKYHYPSIPNYGDITKINYETLPEFDILFTSSPCQDYSSFGKRAGIDGLKGQLIHNIFELTKAKQPKIIIFENVKGLLTIGNGESFKFILEEFSNLGYNVDFELCNAKNYGLAQNRERVFLICYKNMSLSNNISIQKIESAPIVKKIKQDIIKNNPKINLKSINIPLGNNSRMISLKEVLIKNPPETSFVPEKYNILYNNYINQKKE